MSFLFDMFCSFFLLHLHSENTFFFFHTALALHLFGNAGISVKIRDLIFVSFVVLEQTPTKKKKEKKEKPVPLFSRSLLEQWWTSQMISGYCLVLVPYL